MIQKILGSKTQSLRIKSVEVAELDKKIGKIISDLKDTLVAQSDPEGVGLAAPQIGKNYRIFLMSYEGIKKIIINPTIVKISKEKSTKKKDEDKEILEGCLSLPNYYGPLTRARSITIKYKDESWNEIKEKFTGFLAQIVQHEIDHLNGTLFIDHIISQKKPLYKVTGEEWEEVELV